MSKLSTKLSKTLSIALLAGVVGASSLPALANGGSGGGGGGASGGSGLDRPTRQAIDPAVAYRNGIEAYKKADYKKAAREFRKVLSVDRRNPEANYFTGMSYLGQDKPKKSVRYFKTAVKARPEFLLAQEQYALTLVTLQKMEDAQERLAIIQEMATANPSPAMEATLDRVRTAVETGQVPDQLNLALAPEGSFEIGDLIYADAVKLINLGQYQTAINVLYSAQFEVGLHADIQNYLGYTHRKLGQYEQAKSYYAKALQLNPNHIGAHEYLGELYIEIGDMKNAKRQLASLDKLCGFGCAEREELARLVNVRETQFASVRD